MKNVPNHQPDNYINYILIRDLLSTISLWLQCCGQASTPEDEDLCVATCGDHGWIFHGKATGNRGTPVLIWGFS